VNPIDSPSVPSRLTVRNVVRDSHKPAGRTRQTAATPCPLGEPPGPLPPPRAVRRRSVPCKVDREGRGVTTKSCQIAVENDLMPGKWQSWEIGTANTTATRTIVAGGEWGSTRGRDGEGRRQAASENGRCYMAMCHRGWKGP